MFYITLDTYRHKSALQNLTPLLNIHDEESGTVVQCDLGGQVQGPLQPHTHGQGNRLLMLLGMNPCRLLERSAAGTWPLLVEISQKLGSQCPLWEARTVPNPVPAGDADQAPRQGL